MAVQGQAQYPAMVLAAGLGRRMRGYSHSIPKPLVEVAGQPLISYSLTLLKKAGVNRLIYNTHYLAEQVETYMAGRQDFESCASSEQELLETGGGICQAMPQLTESFWVLNSDVICRDSVPTVLSRMKQRWDAEVMQGLLLLVPVEQAIGYHGEGDFSLDSEGALIPPEAGKAKYVFTGVQHLHKRFFEGAPQGKFSLSELYRQALSQTPKTLFGIVHTGEWYHVGDPQARLEAERRLQEEVLCG